MAKVKFNTTTLDRDTGISYAPSDEFVDVSEQFAERIKALQANDPRHKDSFEFEPAKLGRPSKDKDKEND